jgi:bacillopeptidase F (M6 metalloprotease family)
MNRKAMELSVGFLVILIISIIIFGMSIYFFGKIRGAVQDVQTAIDQQTANEIERLIKEENKLLAIPFSTQTGRVGEFIQFGLGIRNLATPGQDKASFAVVVNFDSAYTPDMQTACRPDNPASCNYERIKKEWIGTSQCNTYSIKANQYESIPIVLKVGSKVGDQTPTAKGNYVFNVCVYKGKTCESIPSPCTLEAYRNIKQSGIYYTDSIYPVTVQVER